ncbi:intestinal mucin-like protein isoform X2 [Ambystoma mexicanum]|uniref:intestinal mucin-like protein isoform X2 n=1 Tax=Ambystoma mexicanum TaxID=8296 RepID=UPI0037E96BF1
MTRAARRLNAVGVSIPTPSDSCLTCNCTYEKDPATGAKFPMCEPVICQKTCQPNFEYRERNGQCCGECVLSACVIETENGTHFLQPGNTWSTPDSNCTNYICEKRADQLTLSVQEKTCRTIDPQDCESGIIQRTADGCCQICVAPKSCKMQTRLVEISVGECNATLDMPYCEGVCLSSAKYATKEMGIINECVCCQVSKSSQKQQNVLCEGGGQITWNYLHIELCECKRLNCGS